MTGKMELVLTNNVSVQLWCAGNCRDAMDRNRELNGGKIIGSGDETEHAWGVGFMLSMRARITELAYCPVNS
jgi:hypothetical protein